MRTTINIDDDLVKVARSIARERGISLGQAVSVLIRRGLGSKVEYSLKNGLPVFSVAEDSRRITPEDVASVEDDA